MEKIDFVITWVDGSDKKWIKEKNKYLKIKGNDDFRYRDWDNLKYLFRGIEKFAPWVNKIYFVTCGHLPDFLDTSNEKLVIVKHSDFIDKKYLPTFSSHTIELNLHKIKGLSEKFVYFNDDTFILKPVKEKDFFKKGLPRDSAVISAIAPNGNDFFRNILFNNVQIINKHFKKSEVIKKYPFKWFNLKYHRHLIKTILSMPYNCFLGMHYFHDPSSFLKSSYEDVWKLEYDILDKTCTHKFRDRDDVNQYVVKDYQKARGLFIPRNTNICAFMSVGKDNKIIINTLRKRKYKMICINDSDANIDFEKVKDKINKELNNLLPNKSSFEK